MAHRRIGIRTKLLGGFGFVIAVTILVAVLGVAKLGSLNQRTSAIGNSDLPSVRVIGALNGAESDYRAAQLQHVISADDAAMSAAEKSLADGEAQIRRLFGDYEKTINGATDRAMWSDASARWNAYVKASRAFLPFSRRHDRTGASGVLNGAAGKQFAALSQQLDRWTAVNAGLAAHDVAAAQSTYTTSRTLLLIFALIAVLASLAIAVLLSRAIIRAVRSVLDRLQQLRSEDISSLRAR